MSVKKLQIHLLSNSGEVLHAVSCFGGQVSVFRAGNYQSLQMYQRALAGVPGPERISILLDGHPFEPSEHIFVGFGEHVRDAQTTIESFVQEQGIDPNSVEPYFASFGVQHPLTTPWTGLTKCEERRIRLLTAFQNPDKVLVMNDPLEPLSNQWRNRFAELIVERARANQQIMVVTSLSFRPEPWIDNEAVTRIQVGEERQRTIGFGSVRNTASDVISKLRDIVKDEAKVQQILSGAVAAPLVGPAQVAAPEPEVRQHGWLASLPFLAMFFRPASGESRGLAALLTNPLVSGTAAVAVICAGGYGVLRMNSVKEKTDLAMVQEVVAPQRVESPQEQPPPVQQELPAQSQSVARQMPPAHVEPVEEVRSVYALDEYSESIRNSVMRSFRGDYLRDGEKAAPAPNSPESAGKSAGDSGDLLSLLAKASESDDQKGSASAPVIGGDDPEVSNNYSSQPLSEEEEKREAIRRKFLEAIERAQNSRQGE